MAEISILFPDLELPKRALIGVTEELEEVGTVEFGQTWNGRTILLQPTYGPKYRVTLSNDGENVWTPSSDDLQRGTLITLHSSTWWSATLSAGQTTKILKREPVPGSVAARDTDTHKDKVHCAVNGRIVTIAGRAGSTTILYRPVFHCIVGPVTMGGEATGKSQHWSVEMMEVNAP